MKFKEFMEQHSDLPVAIDLDKITHVHPEKRDSCQIYLGDTDYVVVKTSYAEVCELLCLVVEEPQWDIPASPSKSGKVSTGKNKP